MTNINKEKSPCQCQEEKKEVQLLINKVGCNLLHNMEYLQLPIRCRKMMISITLNNYKVKWHVWRLRWIAPKQILHSSTCMPIFFKEVPFQRFMCFLATSQNDDVKTNGCNVTNFLLLFWIFKGAKTMRFFKFLPLKWRIRQ